MQREMTYRGTQAAWIGLLTWGLALALCLALPGPAWATVEGVPCTAEPTDMTIAYGNLVTCAIDIAGDTDTFRFAGRIGERIVLQAARQSGGGPPAST